MARLLIILAIVVAVAIAILVAKGVLQPAATVQDQPLANTPESPEPSSPPVELNVWRIRMEGGTVATVGQYEGGVLVRAFATMQENGTKLLCTWVGGRWIDGQGRECHGQLLSPDYTEGMIFLPESQEEAMSALRELGAVPEENCIPGLICYSLR